jgi:hypothetical protein
VLFFLWLAFLVVSVIAFFGILVTGRYPRALFDFNVGVLRWSWRVHYYGYGALGTDRYPPFSLADVPDYPAHLDVPYPEQLSRGLVLVKWWLLALPHYLVIGVFAGGGLWFTGRSGGGGSDGWAAGGLIGLLVLIAGVVLLVRGRYPRSLYDFVLGMDRWVLRVVAYAGLMTDSYPPFRLDMGGTDPGPVRPGPLPGSPGGPAAAVPAPGPSGAPHTAPPAHRWTGGRVVALVLGALVVLPSTGLLTAGVGLHWVNQTQREDGWLTSDDEPVSTDGYALVSDDVTLDAAGAEWIVDDLIGEVRLEMTAVDPDVALFAGIAPTRAVRDYLAGVGRSELGTVGPGNGVAGPDGLTDVAGGPPAAPPAEQDFWVAQAAGSGTQTLQWTPTAGDWTVVVMRADGSAGVDTRLAVAATVPGLTTAAWGLLGAGALLLAVGGLIIGLALRRARSTGTPPTTTWTPPAPADDGPVLIGGPGGPR